MATAAAYRMNFMATEMIICTMIKTVLITAMALLTFRVPFDEDLLNKIAVIAKTI